MVLKSSWHTDDMRVLLGLPAAKIGNSQRTLSDGRRVDWYDACSCGGGKLSDKLDGPRFTEEMFEEVRICDVCGNEVINRSCLGEKK